MPLFCQSKNSFNFLRAQLSNSCVGCSWTQLLNCVFQRFSFDIFRRIYALHIHHVSAICSALWQMFDTFYGCMQLRCSQLLSWLSIRVQSKHCEYVPASKTWGPTLIASPLYLTVLWQLIFHAQWPSRCRWRCRLNHELAPGFMLYFIFCIQLLF